LGEGIPGLKIVWKNTIEVIERRLLGLDDEIHRILQYIYEEKKYDIASEIKDYENLKKIISEHMKEPIDPTSEIRKMREKQYLV
jgi:hypothetical protein